MHVSLTARYRSFVPAIWHDPANVRAGDREKSLAPGGHAGKAAVAAAKALFMFSSFALITIEPSSFSYYRSHMICPCTFDNCLPVCRG
jgi:hypothetical protein